MTGEDPDAMMGPLEQRVLETLCGPFSRGIWPPTDESFRLACDIIVSARGERPWYYEEEVGDPDDPDWNVDLIAGFARRVDDKAARDAR